MIYGQSVSLNLLVLKYTYRLNNQAEFSQGRKTADCMISRKKMQIWVWCKKISSSWISSQIHKGANFFYEICKSTVIVCQWRNSKLHGRITGFSLWSQIFIKEERFTSKPPCSWNIKRGIAPDTIRNDLPHSILTRASMFEGWKFEIVQSENRQIGTRHAVRKTGK